MEIEFSKIGGKMHEARKIKFQNLFQMKNFKIEYFYIFPLKSL